MAESDSSSSDELADFVRHVSQALDQLGHSDAARELADTNIAWTTSSEWLGELGLAVRKIQGLATFPDDIAAGLERIMGAVHVAWPDL